MRMQSLELHFEAVDSCKNILFNAIDDKQEANARQLLDAVQDVEKYIYVGGEN